MGRKAKHNYYDLSLRYMRPTQTETINEIFENEEIEGTREEWQDNKTFRKAWKDAALGFKNKKAVKEFEDDTIETKPLAVKFKSEEKIDRTFDIHQIPRNPLNFDDVLEDAKRAIVKQVHDEQNKIRQSVKCVKKKIYFKEAVLSDHQIPFQDDVAIGITFDILEAEQPDLIYLLGDVIDHYAVSRWLTAGDRKVYYLEREMTRYYLAELRNRFPKAQIRWKLGNHELRLWNKILNADASLADLVRDELSFEKIYDTKKLKIDIVGGIEAVGKLYHLHGHESYRKGQVVHVALQNLRQLKRSNICGHWHTFQMFVEKEIDGNWKGGYVNGCLFDATKMPKGTYGAVDTGQRGMSVVHYDEHGNFNVNQLFFIDSKKEYHRDGKKTVKQGYSVSYNNEFLFYERIV